MEISVTLHVAINVEITSVDRTPEIVPAVAKMGLLVEIAILYADRVAPTTVVPTVITQYVMIQQSRV